MLAYRGVVVGAILATATSARAAGGDDVRPGYVGVAGVARAGAGVAGYNLVMLGSEVATGYRFSRWVSLEGFFSSRFATGPSADMEAVGAMCVGEVDHWRTQSFGARVWIHALHLRAVDVSVGPTIGAGVAFDTATLTTGGGDPCRTYVTTAAGWTLDAGLDLALEVRPAPWLGLRLVVETTFDGGKAVDYSVGFGFAVVTLGATFGPVLRF